MLIPSENSVCNRLARLPGMQKVVGSNSLGGQNFSHRKHFKSASIEHLMIVLLTLQCFQIPLVPKMFPVWDFVVGIFANINIIPRYIYETNVVKGLISNFKIKTCYF